jgi:hypothetical protein
MVISTKTQSVEVPETLRIRIEEKLSFLRIESSGRSDAGNGGESRREA